MPDQFKEFEGTHGTTVKAASIIKAMGFDPRKGRLGRGAYFWRKGPLAEHLAAGWYSRSMAYGAYRHTVGDRKCASIYKCD